MTRRPGGVRETRLAPAAEPRTVRTERVAALIEDLRVAKAEEAALHHRYVTGAYKLAFGRDGTQRDIAMLVRTKSTSDPELIRWELRALVGVIENGEVL